MNEPWPPKARWVVAALLCATAHAPAGCGSDTDKPCACDAADASAEAERDGAMEAETGLTDAQAQELLDFCASTFGMQAGLSQTCCTDAEKATEVYQGLQSIVDAYAVACRTLLLESASRGRLVLDQEAAARCAQAYQDTWAARGCQMLWTWVDWESSGCRDVIRGQQPEGAACRLRYECADGLTCAGYMPGVDGVCVVPPTGGTCREEESNLLVRDVMDSLLGTHPACQPGLACLHTAQAIGFCEAASAAGATRAYDRDCKPGLRCHLGICGQQGPDVEGGACLQVTDCVPRLWCDQGFCAPRKAAGAPCDTAVDSCFGFCVPDEGGSEGTCVAFCGSG